MLYFMLYGVGNGDFSPDAQRRNIFKRFRSLVKHIHGPTSPQTLEFYRAGGLTPSSSLTPAPETSRAECLECISGTSSLARRYSLGSTPDTLQIPPIVLISPDSGLR